MGPIVLITGMKPYELKNMKDAQIRKRGAIITAQKLMNPFVNEFVFITRPNEAWSKYAISESQDRKITADLERKTKTAKNLNTLCTSYSDFLLQERKKSNLEDLGRK